MFQELSLRLHGVFILVEQPTSGTDLQILPQLEYPKCGLERFCVAAEPQWRNGTVNTDTL